MWLNVYINEKDICEVDIILNYVKHVIMVFVINKNL